MSKAQRVYCRSCNRWMIEFDDARFEVVRCRDKVRVSYGTKAATRTTPEGRTQFVDPLPWDEMVAAYGDRATDHAWPEADLAPPRPPPTHIEVRCRCGARWRFRRSP